MVKPKDVLLSCLYPRFEYKNHMRYSLLCFSTIVLMQLATHAAATREISVREYRDKMKAGWIGQMAGVALGGPTEFKYKDKIIPLEAVPQWRPELINDSFEQDDLYVEMTFLRTLEKYGIGASIRQAGIDFANSGYPLWCANLAGRNNLRSGIAPPDSGHPKFNKCPNDIDYQIEADFSGLIAPGLPQVAVDMGEKFGRLMNYGDGIYAGQFMGAMYAEAFFEKDPVKIVRAGLKAIPQESQYAEMVRDLLQWHAAAPDDWEKTWHLIQKKYREDPEYQKASNGGIDCKINGAYVVLGLLYGNSDPLQTMVISCRGGQDSDCNPSSSAGVLFTTMGFSNLPAEYKSALHESLVFSHTEYDFPRLVAACEKLARQLVVKQGGRIEQRGGEEFFVIPVREVKPSKLELSWAPGPAAGSRFTKAELSKITRKNLPEQMAEDLKQFAPGWTIANCGPDMDPGLRPDWGGRKNVLVTHPGDPKTACTFSRKVSLKRGTQPVLRFVVANDPRGDTDVVVRVDNKEVLRKSLNGKVQGAWVSQEVDLSPYAGKTVQLQVLNQPTGWSWEAAYWAELKLDGLNRK
jgi:hypothetical protein